MENGEGVCTSLCSVALWLSLRGEFALSVVVLQHTRERFRRDPLAKCWMICDAYITTLQAMHRGRWDDASQACCQLYTLDKQSSLIQRAAINVMRRNLTGARNILEALLVNEKLEPLLRVRAMILLANTKMCSQTPMDAVHILNEASVYARSMYLAYELALIDVHLAFVLYTLRMPVRALKTIRRSMETILANGGIYDMARTNFLFVRCLVGVEDSMFAKAAQLDECKTIIEETIEQFRKMDAHTKMKDVYVWLAQINDELNRIDERNRWSRKFRELERWAPTPVECFNSFF